MLDKLKNKKDKKINHNTNNVDEMYIYIDFLTPNQHSLKNFFYIKKDKEETIIDSISEEDIPDNVKLYRVSNDDNVLRISNSKNKKESSKQQMRKISRGIPISFKAVNKKEYYVTKKSKEIYSEERNIRIAPLNILIDKYLKKNPPEPNKQRVISLLIRTINPEELTVVSWVQNNLGIYAERSFTLDVIAEFEENVEEQVRDTVFSSLSNKGVELSQDSDQIQHILILEEKLLDFSSKNIKKDIYPVSFEIYGYPKSFVALGSVFIAGGVAFSGVSFNTYTKLELNKVLKQEKEIKQKQPNVSEFERNTIQKHVLYYLKDQSIDFKNSLKAAEQVWLPYTSVELTQDRSASRIRVFTETNNGGADLTFDPFLMSKMLERQKAPEGYEKEPVTTSGSFNSYEVSYVKGQ